MNHLQKTFEKAYIVLNDDVTSVTVTNKTKYNSSAVMIEQFHLLHQWFATNGPLNPDKTPLVNINLKHRLSSQSDASYIRSQINLISSIRFLGIENDSFLTW